MQWNSVSEFLSMGGYALYVWGSFGLTAAVVVLELASLSQRRKAVLRSIKSEAKPGEAL